MTFDQPLPFPAKLFMKQFRHDWTTAMVDLFKVLDARLTQDMFPHGDLSFSDRSTKFILEKPGAVNIERDNKVITSK